MDNMYNTNKVNFKQVGKVISILWLIICLCLMVFSVHTVNFKDQLDSISLFKLFLFLLPSTFAYLLTTISWQYLSKNDNIGHASVTKAFFIRQLGETIGQLNPLGVLGGDYYKLKLAERLNIPITGLLNSIVKHRYFTMLSYFIALIISLIVLVLSQHHGLDNLFMVVMVAIILLVAIISLKNGMKPLSHFLHNKSISTKSKLWNFLDQKLSTILTQDLAITSFREVLSLVFLILHWCLGGVEIYIIMTVILGIDISFINAIIFDFGVSFTKSIGQIIPAQLGVEELGNGICLHLLHYSGLGILVSFSLWRRFRFLVWTAISGLFLIVYKLKYKTNASTIYHL